MNGLLHKFMGIELYILMRYAEKIPTKTHS